MLEAGLNVILDCSVGWLVAFGRSFFFFPQGCTSCQLLPTNLIYRIACTDIYWL